MMFLRTLVLSLAVVGGFSAMMCNGRAPLPGRSCSQGVSVPPPPVDAFSYMSMAAGGDQFEIQSSQIALIKASSADVRNFAQMLINDHTLMTSKLQAAAASAGLGAPAPVFSPDQQRMLNELQAAPAGFEFDQLFLRDQVMAHEMALALHSNYASAGDTPALRAVAASAVPVVSMHLVTAGQLQIASGTMLATDFCPATYWCNSDIDAIGQSFSVCCPSDVPVFPPATATLYSAPAITYAQAPIYAAAPVTTAYALPAASTTTFYASAAAAPAVSPATYYASAPAASAATFYASAPAPAVSGALYASGSPLSSGLAAGYIRAFGTVVPAVRVPSNTGYGNVPVGTSAPPLYASPAPVYTSTLVY